MKRHIHTRDSGGGRRIQQAHVNILFTSPTRAAETEAARDRFLAEGWEGVHVARTVFGRRVSAHRQIKEI